MNPAHLHCSHYSHSANAAFVNESTLNHVPTRRQFTGIRILQQLDDHTILAWLTGLRTFIPGCDHWFQPSQLKPQHLNAISSLRECADSLILAWLSSARQSGKCSSFKTRTTSSPLNCTGPVTPSSHIPARNSNIVKQHPLDFNVQRASYVGQVSPPIPSNVTYESFANNDNLERLPVSGSERSYHDQDGDATDNVSLPSSSISRRYLYGCPSCEKRRIIGTCDGWKRHMKEHEVLYICQDCESSECEENKSYTRRANLAKHLRNRHKYSRSNAEELAQKSERRNGRSFYSCGFCIMLFGNIVEQLHHIDVAHFRRFETVNDWDINKVIRGLLLQPDIDDIMHRKFGENFRLVIQGLRWKSSIAKTVQLRLELNEESADDLAAAATDPVNLEAPAPEWAVIDPVLNRSDQDMVYMPAALVQPDPGTSQGYNHLRTTTSTGETAPMHFEDPTPWCSIPNHAIL